MQAETKRNEILTLVLHAVIVYEARAKAAVFCFFILNIATYVLTSAETDSADDI